MGGQILVPFLFLINSLEAQPVSFFTVLNLTDAQLTSDQLAVKNSYLNWPNTMDIQLVQLADPLLYPSGQINLTLPGDTTLYSFTASNIEAYSNGDFRWYGDLTFISGSTGDFNEDPRSGFLSLIGKNGNIFGEMRVDTFIFRMPSLGNGLNALVKATVREYNNDGNVCIKNSESTPPLPPELGGEYTPCPVVTILALYTQRAKNKYPNVEDIIQSSHTLARQVLVNSKVTLNQVDLRLVGVEQLAGFTETNNYEDDELVIKAASSTARQRRAFHKADLVLIFTDDIYTDFNGGYAFVFGDTPADGENAFAFVEVPYATAPSYTYIHEIGHLFGARHQDKDNCWTNGDNSGLPYAHAYAFKKGWGIFSRYYRTVVSSCTDNLERVVIPHLSNPDVEYKNRNTGTDDRNNNARLFRGSVCRIAGNSLSDDLVVEIIGPNEICEDPTLTLNSNVSGVPSPYTYSWKYKFGNGAWSTPSTASTITISIPFQFSGYLYVELTAGNALIQEKATKRVLVNWCFNENPIDRTTLKAKVTDISIYPNPSSGHILIFSDVPFETNAMVGIYNALGHLCATNKLEMNDDARFARLDVSNLPNGQYFVAIQSSYGIQSKRFTIINKS